MTVFLDECLPIPIATILAPYHCGTAKSMGWTSIKNGELLKLVGGSFDVFLTADQGLVYQQNLQNTTLAIVVLSTNNWRRLRDAHEILVEGIERSRLDRYVRILIP